MAQDKVLFTKVLESQLLNTPEKLERFTSAVNELETLVNEVEADPATAGNPFVYMRFITDPVMCCALLCAGAPKNAMRMGMLVKGLVALDELVTEKAHCGEQRPPPHGAGG